MIMGFLKWKYNCIIPLYPEYEKMFVSKPSENFIRAIPLFRTFVQPWHIKRALQKELGEKYESGETSHKYKSIPHFLIIVYQ